MQQQLLAGSGPRRSVALDHYTSFKQFERRFTLCWSHFMCQPLDLQLVAQMLCDVLGLCTK